MEIGDEIWFVDDDKVFQFIVHKYLSGTRYEKQYRIFDDGDRTLMEIISRAKRGEKLPCIIFLDLNMKYMEGWETLDFLKEAARSTKVAIITSSLSEQDRLRANRDPQVLDYLTKPIDRNQLMLSIRRMLSSDAGKVAS
ncbi:MAG: response regulator [Flavobacteriales bacterium]|nr:response regulator [Flavobacteriales bacterium]